MIKLTTTQSNQNDDPTESSQETDVQTMGSLLEKLFAYREANGPDSLSYMSTRLLALENEQEQCQFINEKMDFLKSANIAGGTRFCHKNFVSCMAKINKAVDDEKTQGLLVIGTESKEVLILDKAGMDIQKSIKLPSVGVFLIAQGCYDVDYKLFIACRNGFTYQIKNGKISTSFQVHIESKPTGLVKLDKTIVISGMNQNLYSFYNKGR